MAIPALNGAGKSIPVQFQSRRDDDSDLRMGSTDDDDDEDEASIRI